MRRRDVLRMMAAGSLLAAPRIARAQKPLQFIPQADLAVLDPVWTTAQVTLFHGHMVFDTLYAFDEAYRTQPQMVEGHIVENDGKLWTLTLRDGLRFHDGEPVRGRDAVASIKRWAARDAFGTALMAATEELSAPTDKTIRFRLRKPFPLLPTALGKPSGNLPCIMPERLALTDPFKAVTEMVGSGPYRFLAQERMAGSRAVYEKFANYVPRKGGKPSFTAGPKIANIERVEWNVIPDAATAAGAMQSGEIDWWENASLDLLPVLKSRRDLAVSVGVIPSGAAMRFNALHPPFDNPAIRRALLGAVQQSDFMTAAFGDDRTFWRDNVGVFSSASPLANDAGIEVITRPRDLNKVKADLAAAGYKGERVVLIDPADYAALHALSLVGADMLQKAGMNVEVQTMDWGTVQQRRSKQDVPEGNRGWNVFCTSLIGPNNFDPAGHLAVRGNGKAGWFGWVTSQRLEELRDAWLDAPSLDEQKRIARDIQLQIWQEAPYLPLGEFSTAAVYNKRLSNVPRTFPLFYGVQEA